MTGMPKSWVECRLSDIAEVNPSLDRCPYPQDGTVHFVPMGAVEAESGHIDVSTQRPYSEVRKGYTAFVPGDVLFAKITPCMENGKMAVVPDLPNLVGCGSTEFHVLRAREGISPDYIYYYVSSKSFRFEAEHNMTGAVGQKRVPTSFVAEHTFPLPPIPEQHRIVARIEELFSELDACVESLTKARALLGLYRQSLLKAAFQGKLTADRSNHEWPTIRLGDELAFLTSGSRGWADYYTDRGEIFIRAQNLKHDRLDLTEIAYVTPPKSAEGVRTQVQVGDVLITVTGANVTKAGIVDHDLGVAYVSQHVALCRCRPNLDPKFLFLYLLSETGGRRQLTKAAYGAGKPGLNLENIREVLVPMPSMPEQRKVVELLEANLSNVDETLKTLEVETTRIGTLRQSILKRAFSGRLVPQDPADEPASSLLARLKPQSLAPSRDRRKRA